MHKNTIDIELGARLEKCREGLKLTQEGMAELLGVSRETYQRAESDGKFSKWTRHVVETYLKGLTP